ncbi:IclR family transcriptional regulator [Antrihabitans sp. YC2-6]|uniref:IclR family transcriptional regulator n=1 Tax=Antrihabitans sp. YC2-6 TaxID=2799498 RepID=UPI0018F40FF6|nr:IclR family transcriptional regulator C-terminal domain-containing protein [Antrihabitans sp. YC2-6]MBJ8343795.1 helix-turn-helix domain-containing protein [Antrihabitans sp. YC2-6]
MSPLRDPSRHHPTPVSNSLRIIEAIAVLGLGVSAKEIAAALQMPTATAYRMLNALVAEEYVVRTSDLRGFGLGARLDGLIVAASQPAVPFAARSAIDELRTAVRFAVHVVGFQSGTLRILDADPDHPVRAERELIRHLHASAAGKVLLAYSPSWREALPKKLVRLTARTVVDLSLLRSDLEEVRRTGLASQTDELTDELTCAAVPILDFDGTTRGALCLAGPSSRRDAILTHVDAARECAAILGPLLY